MPHQDSFKKWCSSGVVSAISRRKIIDFTGFSGPFQDTPVTLEGVDSLEDLWQYAQTVYSEEYVMDVIADRYEHLYVEQDGHLYKAIADAPGFGSLWEEIKIWEYCSRLFVLVPLESDDPEGNDYRLLSIRKNAEKPHGYEIVEEILFELK